MLGEVSARHRRRPGPGRGTLAPEQPLAPPLGLTPRLVRGQHSLFRTIAVAKKKRQRENSVSSPVLFLPVYLGAVAYFTSVQITSTISLQSSTLQHSPSLKVYVEGPLCPGCQYRPCWKGGQRRPSGSLVPSQTFYLVPFHRCI